MKVGDLVRVSGLSVPGDPPGRLGIVVEVDVNMWGEETIPSGVRILWCTSEEECVWEDEVYMIE